MNMRGGSTILRTPEVPKNYSYDDLSSASNGCEPFFIYILVMLGDTTNFTNNLTS